MANPAPGFAKHPGHRVELSPADHIVRVSFGGTTLAETTRAIRVDESNYPPRCYIPQADINMAALSQTDRSTHCPFKGDASYWTVTAGGQTAVNAAWGYEAPFDECAAIAGFICFDDTQVTVVVSSSGTEG